MFMLCTFINHTALSIECLKEHEEFLSVKTIDHWNNLPDSSVTAPTIGLFEKLLDEHWNDCMYNIV